MATSGTVNGSVTNLSSYFSFYYTWSAAQDVAGNYSDVTVKTYWHTSDTSYRFDTVGKRNASITIAGTTDSISKAFDCNPWPSGGTYLIQTFTSRVYHEQDGTKTITISARANGTAKDSGGVHRGPSNDTASRGDCTASATIVLDVIPRGAKVTDGPNFTDVQNPTITYANPAGSLVSRIQAAIGTSASAPLSGISYRDISISGTSYTFELTTAERNALRGAVGASTTTLTVYYLLKTTLNGTDFLEAKQATFSLTANDATKPSVSVTTYTINNGSLPASFDGVAIQGKSRLNVAFTATAKYGASIVSQVSVIAGATYSGASFTTGYLALSGTFSLVITVTDSRGIATSYTHTPALTVLPYSNPSVLPHSGQAEVRCFRSDYGGVPNPSSQYIQIMAKKGYSDLGGSNSCRLRYRRREAGASSWDGWNTILDYDSQDEEYSGRRTGTIFDTTKAYEVQLAVIDTLGSTAYVLFDIPTDTTPLHLADGGRRVGIGRYALNTDDTVVIAWPTTFEEGAVLGGVTIPDSNNSSKYLRMNSAGTALEWASGGGGGGSSSYHDLTDVTTANLVIVDGNTTTTYKVLVASD